MKDSFSNMHPLTGFLYFTAVILLSMFIMHPVCLCISLLCALLNAVLLGGKRAVLFTIKFLLPTAAFIIMINPLFNHRGMTLIDYLPWGNPLTLESVLFGAASATLVVSVALWFLSMNRVITSDKLVYLFGKITPSLGLLLAMALRFVPRFTERLKQTLQAQRHLIPLKKKSLTGRFKAGISALSVVVSWSMENAVDTSDAMKSRGYGLKHRTAYSIYRFHRLDLAALCVMAVEIIFMMVTLFFNRIKFTYYPVLTVSTPDVLSVMFFAVYALFMLTPLIINVGEGLRWKQSQSNI